LNISRRASSGTQSTLICSRVCDRSQSEY
jgi:hypothetical protein